MTNRNYFDALVVGAGVVGLAIARRLSISGIKTLIVEKNHRAGEEVSSRNSGVIHGGMYYPTDSLKSSLCVEGNKLLYDYCSLKGITHKRTGKLIIANDSEEHKKLVSIYNQGLINGVKLELLTREEVFNLEPEIRCFSGIFSENTGIIDVPEYVNSLEGDIQHYGGLIAYNTKFISSFKEGSYFKTLLDTGEDFEIESRFLFNCGGLDSECISSSLAGLKKQFIKKIYFGKGHYYKYHGKNPFKNLIYPIPKPGSLGIHLSWDSANQLKFGPNLKWVDSINYAFEEGLKEEFLSAIKVYWPEIESERLQPDYTGIRPKIYNQGQNGEDFYFSLPESHKLEGFYGLQGIESPGLTSSLAISEYVFDLVQSRM
ncbi:NAD(P)/FAD-dependent oxidoreductase [Gammaproteobacteria bacterium]|nr:NAD(P)/FAD-dependent oxidoreductase [Gammaproteobacteria bacterium]